MIAKPFGWVLFSAGLLLAGGVQAATPSCLSLHDGWVRVSPATSMAMAAGYGQLRNRCATAQVVSGASSPRFAEVSLHETTLVEGVSRMRPVSRLEVPAKGAVTLAPGGLHLMLMHGTQALVAGQIVPLELHLADGGKVPLALQARQP